MVAIIDYGMGNVASVQKALNFLNIESIITNDHSIIKDSSVILLPGVGSFAQGMINLQEFNLVEILNNEIIIHKKPFLGICLGMQLIMQKGNEPYECSGLGWIKGEVKKFNTSNISIPHMGWNNIDVLNDTYFNKLTSQDFYFIHSYHVEVSNIQHVAATVNYVQDVVASIQKDNIFATQFHPEKSQNNGLTLLKTFFELNA
jgi:glutamine amidotransferase